MSLLCHTFVQSFVKTTFFLIVFLAVGCAAQKNRSDNRLVNKRQQDYNFMQNLTARYNILYHCNLMLDQEEDVIRTNKKENYQHQLSVFEEPESRGDAHASMDSAINKAYKVVNEKQQSKYISEAYFIIAKAQYLKGDFYNANAYFDYLIKSIDQESYAHYKPLAFAWKSRALVQINRLAQAQSAIDSALHYQSKKREVNTFVHAAAANLLLQLDAYSDAIQHLELALKSNRNKRDANRWMYLLGQLYLQVDQPQKALISFKKVANANVNYSLAFQANLQAAALIAQRYDGSNDQAAPFKRMLRDGKNQGFEDQILFEIGKIYINKGDEDQAIAYFNRSLNQSSNNLQQTTNTYLALFNLFFKKQQYAQAHMYIDSTKQSLPSDYPDIKKTRRKIAYMSELITLYQKSAAIDTVLNLALASDYQRDSMINNFAQQQLKEQLQLLQLQNTSTKPTNNQAPNTAFLVQNAFNRNSTSNGGFYFNNPEAMMVGASVFKSRWGNRQLRDDWRISSSEIQLQNPTQPNVVPAQQKVVASVFDQELFMYTQRNRYLQLIPHNAHAQDSLELLRQQNLLSIGNIYKDYVLDNAEAITVYTLFEAKYPDSKSLPEVYYTLYRLYDEVDKPQSLAYKNKLMAQFPHSIYAEAASNPNFLDDLKKKRKIWNEAYDKMYISYTNEAFAEVIDLADTFLLDVGQKSTLNPQVAYLKTLAIGRTKSVQIFEQSLLHLLDQYPDDQLVAPLAREHLAFVQRNSAYFATIPNALQKTDVNRPTFVDEPHMTEWPALYIVGDYRTSEPIHSPQKIEEKKEVQLSIKKEEKKEIKEVLMRTHLDEKENVSAAIKDGKIKTDIDIKQIQVGAILKDTSSNIYSDEQLFPLDAEYYFVINVNRPHLNLSPSRYGIGQFIRSRYARLKINHQLKDIDTQNQLILVGVFTTLKDVKTFESTFLPLIEDIMKIPTENYDTFVVTKEMLTTLIDRSHLDKYQQFYLEQ